MCTSVQSNCSFSRRKLTSLWAAHNHLWKANPVETSGGWRETTSAKWCAQVSHGYIRVKMPIRSFASLSCPAVGFSGYCAASVCRNIHVHLPRSSGDVSFPRIIYRGMERGSGQMKWSTRVATPRTRTEETSAVVVATRETLAKIWHFRRSRWLVARRARFFFVRFRISWSLLKWWSGHELGQETAIDHKITWLCASGRKFRVRTTRCSHIYLLVFAFCRIWNIFLQLIRMKVLHTYTHIRLMRPFKGIHNCWTVWSSY